MLAPGLLDLTAALLILRDVWGIGTDSRSLWGGLWCADLSTYEQVRVLPLAPLVRLPCDDVRRGLDVLQEVRESLAV